MRRGEAIQKQAECGVPPPSPARGTISDLRFRTLLGEEAWAALLPQVRARFSHRRGACRTIVYAGTVVACRMSRAGRLLAQAARLIGSPLPLGTDCDVPAAVSVTESPGGGQCWTRIYGRRRGFPQVINSCKRFAGPTGLEEYLGAGFGIALDVRVEDGGLHFLSNHYFWCGAGLRLRLPKWLAPGAMRVSHFDCGDGSFDFVLQLDHRALGELIHQRARFRERPDEDGEGA